MGFFDISIVNVSLPTIARYFSVDIGMVTWVVIIYVLAISSFLIAFGSLADRKGYKKIFLTGFAVFITGSFLSGIAPTFDLLILFRFVQATGAAMFTALTAAMVTAYLPAEKRGRYMGYVATFASVGFAFGPVIGGFLTQYLSWNWIFFINVPIGIIGIILGLSVLHEKEKKQFKKRFDFIGVILLLLAQTTLIFALNRGLQLGWTSPTILLSVGTSIISWILFIWRESRYSEPILKLDLFRNRKISLATFGNFFFNMPNAGILVLIPFYLELVKGLQVSQVGLILSVAAIAVIIIGPIAGRISDRVEPNRVTAVGALIGVISLFLFSTFGIDSTIPYIVMVFFILGASIAVFNPPNMKFIMGESPEEMRAVTSGIVTTARMTANAFGIAILQTVAVISIYLTSNGTANVKNISPDLIVVGFHDAFLVGAFILIIALFLILLIRKN